METTRSFVLVMLRLLLQRLTSRALFRNVLVVTLLTVLFGLMLTYYVLVLVGLKSWGGVVAWDVIPTFFAQSVVLTDALAIPWWVLPLAAMTLPAALFGLCWHYLKCFDWTAPVARHIPGSIIAVGTLAVSVCARSAAPIAAGDWRAAAAMASVA